jgi:hypothetical protein
MTANPRTANSPRRPVRARDVLRPNRRGPTEAGSTALSGAQRAGHARAAATGAFIAVRAIEALDEDLGAMLVRVLERYTALGEAGRQSRIDPGTPIYVDLAQVRSIPASVTAELDVYVDRLHRATVTAVLEVEFGLFGVRAVVQDGWVTGVDGQQSVTAALKVESIQVGNRAPVPLEGCTLFEGGSRTEWAPVALPSPIPLGDNPGDQAGAALY